MSRSRKFSFVAGGVVAFILLAAVGYFVIRQGDASAEATDIIQSAEASEAAVPVEVVEAATGWVARTLSTSSTVEAEQSAQVLAKVSGVVTEVAVREGTFVEKNQILAKVDDEEKKLAVEKAVLTLKKAEAELNRSQLSFDQEPHLQVRLRESNLRPRPRPDRARDGRARVPLHGNQSTVRRTGDGEGDRCRQGDPAW